jgi:hypothetical protein
MRTALGVVVLISTLGVALTRVSSSLPAARSIDTVAEQYVSLALALDALHPGEVDAYFGPARLRLDVRTPGSLEALTAETTALSTTASGLPDDGAGRRARLLGHLRALSARVEARRAAGRGRLREDARQWYGLAVDAVPAAAVAAARAGLDAQLPGPGPLHARLRMHRQEMIVAESRRRAVFAAALDQCRTRTMSHWPLPAGDALEISWRGGQGGAAWHRYLGQGRSALVVDPAGVALFDSAIDVACHEAYPGHHAQFLRLETAFGQAIPPEEQIVLLHAPDTALREGAAQYGVDLAFPADDRLGFELEVLGPLAGVSSARIRRNHALRAHLRVLERLVSSQLVAWDEGVLTEAEAVRQLEEEALIGNGAALLRYAREHGAYALAYTLGRDRVAGTVAAERARTGAGRWVVLADLIQSGMGAEAPRRGVATPRS